MKLGTFILGALLLFNTSHAKAVDANSELKPAKFYQLQDGVWQSIEKETRTMRNFSRSGASVKDIITVGKLVWEIVKDGEPILDFKSERISVLPDDAASAFDLTHWLEPQTETYKIVYENIFGFEMIVFSYRLVFTPGGRFNGNGLYLTNVAIEPLDVDVAWGYDLNAKFEALEVVNLGSQEEPLVGLELKLTWSIESIIQDKLEQANFFIRGDGRWSLL